MCFTFESKHLSFTFDDVVDKKECEHDMTTYFAAIVPSSLLIVTTSSCPRVDA